MKTFIVVMISIYGLRAAWMALRLGSNDYPAMKEITPAEDILRLLFSIGFIVWGSLVIF